MPIDLTGQTFGRLTALSPETIKGRRQWICECECGNVKSINQYSLTAGKTHSCGCLSAEAARRRLTEHPIAGRSK